MKAYKIDLSGFTGKVREVVSGAVQKKAFALGYAWHRKDKIVDEIESAYLFFWADGNMGQLDDNQRDYYLDSSDYQEITAADFLALETAKEPEFKAFDKVLTRDDDYDKWACDLFSHKEAEHPYVCVGAYWEQCVPCE